MILNIFAHPKDSAETTAHNPLHGERGTAGRSVRLIAKTECASVSSVRCHHFRSLRTPTEPARDRFNSAGGKGVLRWREGGHRFRRIDDCGNPVSSPPGKRFGSVPGIPGMVIIKHRVSMASRDGPIRALGRGCETTIAVMHVRVPGCGQAYTIRFAGHNGLPPIDQPVSSHATPVIVE